MTLKNAYCEVCGFEPQNRSQALNHAATCGSIVREKENPVTRKPPIDRSVERFAEDGTQLVFAISPFGASETREQRLERWQARGWYDPECSMCAAIPAHPTLSPFQPQHKAGAYCRSGGRPHCTCDGCF